MQKKEISETEQAQITQHLQLNPLLMINNSKIITIIKQGRSESDTTVPLNVKQSNHRIKYHISTNYH